MWKWGLWRRGCVQSVTSLGSTRVDKLNHKCVKKVLGGERSFVFPLGGAKLAKEARLTKAQNAESVTQGHNSPKLVSHRIGCRY